MKEAREVSAFTVVKSVLKDSVKSVESINNRKELEKSEKASIAYAWYPVLTLGYGERLGVWFRGCPRKCPDCISPELQSFDKTKTCSIAQILDEVPEGASPDGLTISGGEPFSQPVAVLELIRAYKKKYSGDVLIFTGYTLEELKIMNSDSVKKILEEADVIIDGRYEKEEDDGLGLRGSKNQKIHVSGYKERYEDAENWTREVQYVFAKNRLWMIGIPSKI